VNDYSLRFTTVHMFDDMRTSATQYIRGLNGRIEHRACHGISDTHPPTNVRYEYGPLRVLIFNRDLGYTFEVEPATLVYTAFRANEHGGPAWAKPRKAEPVKRSGKTVQSHIETVDTGERKKLFGRTARRVIEKTRQVRDSEMLSESECDRWYIDPPAAWAKLHPPLKAGSYCYLTVGTGERDDYEFSEAGKRETGFALMSIRTNRSSFKDQAGTARTHTGVYRDEVTEFSEAPLARELFVPPLDFKRVAQLPEKDARYAPTFRARVRWEMLKDSFSLPNRMAGYVG
jgi:hypothetical protein